MSAGEFRASVRRRAAETPRRIALTEWEDDRILATVERLVADGLATPVLVGDPDGIRGRVAARGIEDAVEIVDATAPTDRHVAHLLARRGRKGLDEAGARATLSDPLHVAACMVALGEVDGTVSGCVRTTGDVMRAAFWCVGPTPGVKTVSSSFYMCVPDFRGRGPETLSYTDAAVVQYPDAAQLSDIAFAACAARRRIVGDEPVVAFLSHSTRGSAEGPTVDLMREAARLFAERAPEVASDGELQVDAAIIASVAGRKAPGSAVAGGANVLVFPNLDAGNIAYKLTERLTGGDAVGPIVQGLAAPCNDLSRGADAEDIVDTVCVTALTATGAAGS